MENALTTPPKTQIQTGSNLIDSICTPPQNLQCNTNANSQNSVNESRLTGPTPDRLKVSKAFKYPERYKSPTDLMMSPISKGLLARNRKPGAGVLLPPPSTNQIMMKDLTFQEVGFSRT